MVDVFGHKITKKIASLKSWYFWYASVRLAVLFSHNSSLASVLRNVQVPLPKTQTHAKRLVMKETSVSILSRSLAAQGSKHSAKTWQWWKSLELNYSVTRNETVKECWVTILHFWLFSHIKREDESAKMKNICAKLRLVCISFLECEQAVNSVWRETEQSLHSLCM